VIAPHSDLVQHELERIARTPALDVAEEMADDDWTLLGHPVQDVLVGEVGSSYGAGNRCAWPTTPLDLECCFVPCEGGDDRLVAAAEKANRHHVRSVRGLLVG
jgi:hypothetical protein